MKKYSTASDNKKKKENLPIRENCEILCHYIVTKVIDQLWVVSHKHVQLLDMLSHDLLKSYYLTITCLLCSLCTGVENDFYASHKSS